MPAVQEKSLVRRPLEPAETKRRGKIIGDLALPSETFAHRSVEKRMVGMPELRPGNRLVV
jgi:hypothetical protein